VLRPPPRPQPVVDLSPPALTDACLSSFEAVNRERPTDLGTARSTL